MRRVLVALALVAGCTPPAPPAPAHKPDAAVDLTARVVGNPRAGAPCGLVVHAAPRFEGDFEVEVVLPGGVTRTAGDTKWSGRTKANENREVRLDFTCDGARREILVRATATAGGIRQTCVIPVVLNEDGSSPPSKGVRKTNSRGETILEFPSR